MYAFAMAVMSLGALAALAIACGEVTTVMPAPATGATSCFAMLSDMYAKSISVSSMSTQWSASA